ncbi:HIRAN domain-containing protein [Sphingobium sp. AN558]|uniref:HIRAN domain-containing protein n=1 Tax=Sphingobium sp. AN558 TaxID=3133442 RepID=UPI0030C5DEF2
MRHISLAVVGVQFDNKKGPPRRFVVEMCTPGEPVELRPEPKNPADRNAIAVYSARGVQLGYLTAERAPMIGKAMRDGIVQAIFQRKEKWGATIRAHLDGSVPTLPDPADSRAADWPPPGSQDADWWPDEEWPDE